MAPPRTSEAAGNRGPGETQTKPTADHPNRKSWLKTAPDIDNRKAVQLKNRGKQTRWQLVRYTNARK
ncbi:hypothetical protein [Duncaniella dubosii]|uniref:hypothetical protein n=1 Tax=Duncaniella dubosii TaxID=2518971 RepID=UPI003F666232